MDTFPIAVAFQYLSPGVDDKSYAGDINPYIDDDYHSRSSKPLKDMAIILKSVFFSFMLRIVFLNKFCKIAYPIQHCYVMLRFRWSTNHYLSQCWPISMSPYGVTRPQWVNSPCGDYIRNKPHCRASIVNGLCYHTTFTEILITYWMNFSLTNRRFLRNPFIGINWCLVCMNQTFPQYFTEI